MEKEEKGRLISQHNILREGYIKILSDKESLINWGAANLEAVYLSKLGLLQIEQLELQLQIKSLKRKLELSRAAINTGSIPDFLAIELKVAAQLAQAEREIMQQIKQVEAAKAHLTHLESPQRSSDLRKVYRRIAKFLHPDVNPALTEEQKELWIKLQDAYQSGDLERLKSLEIVYEKEIHRQESHLANLSEEQLKIRIETLKEGIRILEKEVAEINSKFPFTIKDKINNEEWVAAEQAIIKKEIKKMKKYEQELQTEYKKIKQFYE